LLNLISKNQLALVSAKTGRNTDQSSQAVHWLVGHVRRGKRELLLYKIS